MPHVTTAFNGIRFSWLGNVKAHPTRNVSVNRRAGPINPRSEATPSIVMDDSIITCVTKITLLRSTMSDIAPAIRPKRSVGSVLAVCTSATISAEGVSVAISHDEMVACIV